MKVGQEIYVNDAIGNVVILDIKEDYLILCRLGNGTFIKAKDYFMENDKLSWEHGEYYWSFDKLIEAINKIK